MKVGFSRIDSYQVAVGGSRRDRAEEIARRRRGEAENRKGVEAWRTRRSRGAGGSMGGRREVDREDRKP